MTPLCLVLVKRSVRTHWLGLGRQTYSCRTAGRSGQQLQPAPKRTVPPAQEQEIPNSKAIAEPKPDRPFSIEDLAASQAEPQGLEFSGSGRERCQGSLDKARGRLRLHPRNAVACLGWLARPLLSSGLPVPSPAREPAASLGWAFPASGPTKPRHRESLPAVLGFVVRYAQPRRAGAPGPAPGYPSGSQSKWRPLSDEAGLYGRPRHNAARLGWGGSTRRARPAWSGRALGDPSHVSGRLAENALWHSFGRKRW